MARLRRATKVAKANGVPQPHTPSVIRGRSVSLPRGGGGVVPTTLAEAGTLSRLGPACLPEPARLPVASVHTSAPVQVVAASAAARAPEPLRMAPDALAQRPAPEAAPTLATMKVVESLLLNSPDVEVQEERLDFESAAPESVSRENVTPVASEEPQQ